MPFDTKYYLDSARKQLDEAEKISAAISNENTKLKTELGVLQKFLPIPFLSKSYYVTPGWGGNSYWNTNTLEADYQEAMEIAKKNEQINVENTELVNRVISLIRASGFSQTVSVYKKKKWVKEDANWYSALVGAVPEGFRGKNSVEEKYKTVLAGKKKDDDARAQKIAQQEKEAVASRELKRKNIIFVEVAKELGVDPLENTPESLLEILLEKDKYLNLGYAMLRARNEGYDAFDCVERALNELDTDDIKDAKIFVCINDLLSSEETDGRIFRDCKWSYDKIFGLADSSLWSLYLRLCPLIGA